MTDEANWKQVVEATVTEFGKLDILVNNAGISGSAVEDLFDTAAWDKIMDVNARGAFFGMKYAIPEMRKAGGGSIVNISSISGVTGQRGIHAAYNASKGAVRTMTKVGAVQQGRHNIRVNSVHPGLMPPMRTSGRTADPVVRAKMLEHGAARPRRPGRGGRQRGLVPRLGRGLLRHRRRALRRRRVSGRVVIGPRASRPHLLVKRARRPRSRP